MNVTVGQRHLADLVPVEGVPQDRTPSSGASPTRSPARTTTATRAGGSYDFAMRPNIAQQMREQTVVQARETIERRVNELGVPSRTSRCTATPATSCWCSCPASRRRARQGDHPLHRAAAAEDRRAGPGVDARALLTQYGGKLPDDMEVVRRRVERRAGGTQYYLVKKLARSPARTCGLPGRRSTRTAARRSVLADRAPAPRSSAS
jgi:hypothetical protein